MPTLLATPLALFLWIFTFAIGLHYLREYAHTDATASDTQEVASSEAIALAATAAAAAHSFAPAATGLAAGIACQACTQAAATAKECQCQEKCDCGVCCCDKQTTH